MIAASGFFGKLIPYLGGRGRRFLPGEDAPREPEEPAAEPELPPVPLFDFSGEGVQRWALLLSDDTMFRSLPGSELFVRLRGPQGEESDAALRRSGALFLALPVGGRLFAL